MEVVNRFVDCLKSNFDFEKEPSEELKTYLEKALSEDRILIFENMDSIYGFLVYFLYDKDQVDEQKRNVGSLKWVSSNPCGDHIHIDSCFVAERFRKNINFLSLRNFFKVKFPNVFYINWFKSVGDKKKFYQARLR